VCYTRSQQLPEEESMTKTITNRKEAVAWQDHYDPLAPKVGDMAPDFELVDTTGGNTVRLSGFRGKRLVVLVFGSFT
jgi:peroxiredoxin